MKKNQTASAYTPKQGFCRLWKPPGKEIENEDETESPAKYRYWHLATRASIIETLFTRNYIQRKSSLIPTEKGLQVYELVKDRKIADVAMTAEWELALQNRKQRSGCKGTFQKEMEKLRSSITNELLQTSIAH